VLGSPDWDSPEAFLAPKLSDNMTRRHLARQNKSIRREKCPFLWIEFDALNRCSMGASSLRRILKPYALRDFTVLKI
jgi:hypothetical protein